MAKKKKKRTTKRTRAKKSNPKDAPGTPAQRLSSIIKSCRDIMRKDKGLNGDLDRLPQLTWMMFLKFLDDLEQQDETRAQLADANHQPLIPKPYRWRDWASQADGITGDELVAFINNDEAIRPDGQRGPGLFAKLRGLQGAEGGDRRDVVALVFRDTANRMLNGYLVRDVLNKLNEVHFTSSDEVHTLSVLYEGMLKEMRDAAGDSGEFYTPRPIVKLVVSAIDPKLGETVLDPACGTGGFLAESFDHLTKQVKTNKDREILQSHTLVGGEAKSLPYLLAEMNLLLHGVNVPNIEYGNSLAVKLTEIGNKDRVDVIMTNPPFGGEEESGIKANFPSDMQTAETALLFLQLIMRRLKRAGARGKAGGRAAVVVPNGTLFGDGVGARIKQLLLEEFNLHTIVRLPGGVFAPYTGIPTNILFFNAPGPTEEIWYYEQPSREGKRGFSKSSPIRFDELSDCLAWIRNPEGGPHAWRVTAQTVSENGFNLDQRNPNSEEVAVRKPPMQIVREIVENEQQILKLIKEVSAELEPRT